MNTDFQNHLIKFSTNPYLFIGSGLSRRFISLPTWEELLIAFFDVSTIDGDYEYYHSKSNGNLPTLASNLSKEFHEIWWKSLNFKDKRKEFKSQAKEKLDIPFKIQLSDIVKTKSAINLNYQKEIDLLKTSVIDGIITTNWDDFLEKTFSDYKVYIGQQELLFSEGISIGEIYKIHGSISNPQSLIVTEEDYLNFNERNAYLAAKLLTIFVEHPIIFLGYSLSDENIQQIIESIVRCVDSKNLDKLKDRLIFVEWSKGHEFEMKDSSIKLIDNKVLPIKLVTTDSFEPIFQTLSSIKRQIPVKVLRKIKNSVIEFVKSAKPTSKVYIQNIETINDDTKIEYAIGIGVATQFSSHGYRAISAIDIIEDIIHDNKNFETNKLIEHTFPSLLKGNVFLPISKYLRQLGYLNKDGELTSEGFKKTKDLFTIRANIPNCFLPTENYRKKKTEIQRDHNGIESIIKKFDKYHSIVMIPLLEYKSINLSELQHFLQDCFIHSKYKKHTNFRKLVCIYDYLKFGLESVV